MEDWWRGAGTAVLGGFSAPCLCVGSLEGGGHEDTSDGDENMVDEGRGSGDGGGDKHL